MNRQTGGMKYIFLAMAGALALAAAGLWIWYRNGSATVSPERALAAGPAKFVMTGTQGEVVTEQALQGRFHLIFFGYTHCPDVCPTSLAGVATAWQALTPAQRQQLQVVFISVDPARDTPETLRAYVQSFDADFAGWVGPAAELEKLAQRFSAIYQRRPAVAGTENRDAYDFDHSSLLYLVNREGVVVDRISALDKPEAIQAWLAARLLRPD